MRLCDSMSRPNIDMRGVWLESLRRDIWLEIVKLFECEPFKYYWDANVKPGEEVRRDIDLRDSESVLFFGEFQVETDIDIRDRLRVSPLITSIANKNVENIPAEWSNYITNLKIPFGNPATCNGVRKLEHGYFPNKRITFIFENIDEKEIWVGLRIEGCICEMDKDEMVKFRNILNIINNRVITTLGL